MRTVGVRELKARLSEELRAENQSARDRVQELELYVEGRRTIWDELNARLEQYEDTLAGMEKVIESKDTRIAGQEEEKEQLAVRILELERQALRRRLPGSKRTWIAFRGGAYSGANLFALRSPKVLPALELWRLGATVVGTVGATDSVIRALCARS